MPQASDDPSADLAPVDLVPLAQEAVVLAKAVLARVALVPAGLDLADLVQLEGPVALTTDHPAAVPALAPTVPRGPVRQENPETADPVCQQTPDCVSPVAQRCPLQ